MSFSDLLLIFSSSILASNYVLSSFFGIESISSSDKEGVKKNLFNSLSLLIVLFVSAIILWPLESYIIGKGAQYLRLFVFAIALTFVSYLYSVLAKKNRDELISTITNSLILGSLLSFQSSGYSLLEMLFASLGAACAYFVVLLAISGVKERIKEDYIPRPFRGAPITIMAIGFISLCIYAF